MDREHDDTKHISSSRASRDTDCHIQIHTKIRMKCGRTITPILQAETA